MRTKELAAEIVAVCNAATDAERERCAKIADAVAAEAQEQIERNDEYKARTGSTDETCNDLCRHKKSAAERIAADIRRGH